MNTVQYDSLPAKVREVLDAHSDCDNTYESCEQCKIALNGIGWTCDYGLDAEIYSVVPMSNRQFHIGDKVKVVRQMGTPKGCEHLIQTHNKEGVIVRLEEWRPYRLVETLGLDTTGYSRVGVKLDVPPKPGFMESIYFIYPEDLDLVMSFFHVDYFEE